MFFSEWHFSCDLDIDCFIVKMHTFIYLWISSKELWATIWEDLQIWESFVGHKVHKILLLRLSRVRKYWLRLGAAFDKFSIFGHLCSFCVCVAIRRYFFPPFPQFADLAPGSFGGFVSFLASVFISVGLEAIIQICLCSPSLARLALSFDNSSREEIVQMSDLASYVTHPGQWFGKTRVSVTSRDGYSFLNG